ncbi:MAG TPA: Rid family detoxifying hydrolase [Syntrophomonas sp.]|mgnify:FL=1|nr:Rid family detoxifying hydrolase [Syntrophomonas sp.]
MDKKTVVSSKIPVVGPYSSAVEANGFVFLSGQIPVDPETGEMIGDIKGATRQVLVNIRSLLSEMGLSLAHIVKTTIFLKNMDEFSAVNEVYAEFFTSEPPARSTVEVSALPKGAPLEIEAVAVKG